MAPFSSMASLTEYRRSAGGCAGGGAGCGAGARGAHPARSSAPQQAKRRADIESTTVEETAGQTPVLPLRCVMLLALACAPAGGGAAGGVIGRARPARGGGRPFLGPAGAAGG